MAAGDNPERLRDERCFAALCGVAPLDASSGEPAPASLEPWWQSRREPCVMGNLVRALAVHEDTKAYAAGRLTEGRTKLEILRCLKRYIAREVFKP